MSEPIRQAVLSLYAEVDREVAAAGPVCIASGRCCRFKEYGHTLFVSQLEADVLLRDAPPYDPASVTADFCPFQQGNLCTAREPRPLGCRVYYCDPNYQQTAEALSEKYLHKLKELADEHGTGWRYAPLHVFLREEEVEPQRHRDTEKQSKTNEEQATPPPSLLSLGLLCVSVSLWFNLFTALRLGILVSVLLVPLCGCGGRSKLEPAPSESEPPGPGYFEDKTPTSHLLHTYKNGIEAGHASILESLGGGVALLDYNRDGLLDVFVTGGGSFGGPDKKLIQGLPCRLYKNLGNWQFHDVTADVGLDRLAAGEPWFYTHGVAVADYDNDGWPDLLVTGWGRLALLHNVSDGKGGRRFVDVTRTAGLTSTSWSTSAAWGDLDGDGYADLYVCHYVDWSWANNPPCKDYRDGKMPDVCAPKRFQALPHLLYRNNGNGTFTDVSNVAGLRLPRQDADYARLTHLDELARKQLRKADVERDFGKGLGVLFFDADDDGRLDVYVANDTTANFLYLNKGGGRFEEVGVERGVAFDENGSPNGSMGIDVADYNGAGRLSLFVTNYQNENHALYRNQGKGMFAYASRPTGIAALGRLFVGFGTGFLDYDLDGNEDLFISNGHVVYHPTLPAEVKQSPILLRNGRKAKDKPIDVTFANVSEQAGPYFRGKYLGRGVAIGDLDNDGRADLVVNPMNEPVVLLRNRHESGHHWLGVEVAREGNCDAVGTKLTLEVGGQKLLRVVKGGGSYLSAGDPRVVFGLGAETKVGKLTVRWPSGREEVWEGLAVDRYSRVVEGKPGT